MEIRTTSAQKRLIERAAKLSGTPVTDFVVSNIQQAAAKTIREAQSLFLRDKAREVFVKALLNPPELNETLKSAAAEQPPQPKLRIEPLGPTHDRAAFSCGIPPLDRYLQTQGSQDMRKQLTAVYVLAPDRKAIAGYYTLSAYSVGLDKITEEIDANARGARNPNWKACKKHCVQRPGYRRDFAYGCLEAEFDKFCACRLVGGCG